MKQYDLESVDIYVSYDPASFIICCITMSVFLELGVDYNWLCCCCRCNYAYFSSSNYNFYFEGILPSQLGLMILYYGLQRKTDSNSKLANYKSSSLYSDLSFNSFSFLFFSEIMHVPLSGHGVQYSLFIFIGIYNSINCLNYKPSSITFFPLYTYSLVLSGQKYCFLSLVGLIISD